MFSISLKMIFRSWARNKIYFVISMLSLIIGLTCSVLLIGFVANEYNIAHVVKGGGQWYLLQEQNVYYSNEEVMANHTLNGGRALFSVLSRKSKISVCAMTITNRLKRIMVKQYLMLLFMQLPLISPICFSLNFWLEI